MIGRFDEVKPQQVPFIDLYFVYCAHQVSYFFLLFLCNFFFSFGYLITQSS